MRFVGGAEIARFIREHPPETEMVRAWVHEMKCRRWTRPEAVKADLRGADISQPPTIRFHLVSAPVLIDTLVDFHNGIVVLTDIRKVTREANGLQVHHGSA